MAGGQWIVLLPGEYAETSEIYGPFRGETQARKACNAWNMARARGETEDRATVLPILPASHLAEAN